MAEWKEVRPGVHELWLESVRAVVMHYSDHEHAWWIEGGDSVEGAMRFSRRTRGLPLDDAKAAAEQALREMHRALSAHVAPVLRWIESPGGWTATLGCWILTARQNCWTIRQEIALGWCRDVVRSPSVVSGYRADEAQARRDAELVLRSFGVTFRTEKRGPAPVIAMEDAVDSFVVGGAIGGACKATTRPDGAQKRRECSQCESAARADIAHICDWIMEARKAHADALAALRAFGEAISAVALVQFEQFVSDVPVLRWVADSEPGWSRAEVSGWELEAWNGNWAMAHRSGFSKLSPRPNRASEEDNRRAVERELRSLGVVFRTEGA